jgi:hypothetical protein
MKTMIWGTLLEKTARHVALIACLCILFNASGQTNIKNGAVMLLVAGASALHLLGKSFKGRKLTKQT